MAKFKAAHELVAVELSARLTDGTGDTETRCGSVADSAAGTGPPETVDGFVGTPRALGTAMVAVTEAERGGGLDVFGVTLAIL
jgi:hypothetical protein